MAKKEKKVSINSLDKVFKENFDNNNITAEWYGVEVVMKPNISFSEVIEFVNDVTTSCFQDEYGFMPEVADFVIKCNILTKYANISLPQNLEHRYELVYSSDIVEFVRKHINVSQLDEIVSSINKKISFLCNSNVMSIQKQMADLVSTFENMQQQTADMFENVTPEDMAKILGAFEGGAFSEDKIVEAYLNKSNKKAEDEVGEEQTE